MTRETAIERWKFMANTVFKAENAISDEWHPKLRATKDADPKTKSRIADEYLTALATEIVSHTTDEELAKLED